MTPEQFQEELRAIYESYCAGDLDEAGYAVAIAQAQQDYRDRKERTMAEKFTVIRIFKKDADGIRKEYPQYRSDAVRIREILRMRGNFLPAPEGAEFVPVVEVPGKKGKNDDRPIIIRG